MNILYWLLFVLSSVVCEALLYNLRGDKKSLINEHIFFTIHRAIVFYIIFKEYEWREILKYLGVCVITFPFLHSSVYFPLRHWLDKTIYKKWWWCDSEASSAWSDKYLIAPIRLLLFIIGSVYSTTNF